MHQNIQLKATKSKGLMKTPFSINLSAETHSSQTPPKEYLSNIQK